LLTISAAATLAASLAGPAAAGPFPEVVDLPTGWRAEGVATGTGSSVYAGSLATGAVWKGDLRSGAGDVLVPGGEGRVAVGLKVSRGLLFVAGGPTGQAHVYDASTGADVADFQLGAPADSFINDVTVTTKAAWFTDSFNATLYRLPLTSGVPAGEPVAVRLSGEWEQIPAPSPEQPAFNANGIAATRDGQNLLVINSTTGNLYRVDPQTGEATEVQTDADLTSGDGILLRGKQLAVVRNRLNEIAVVKLSSNLESATLVETLTDPDFRVPTTVASFGHTLYAVNARFGSGDPTELPYEIVKVDGS
jgi:sugar lactone lactonase YvrE